MQEVWFLFKLLEAIFGVLCINFHVRGFLNYEEPLQHNLFYCGIFFGFTMLAIFGNIGICLGVATTPKLEALFGSLAAVTHIIASMLSMMHAEKDSHLWYLTDFEEPLHPFFYYSKGQSMTSLVCGALYLLNAVLALDMLIIRRGSFLVSPELDSDDDQMIADNDTTIRPIRMYVFGKSTQRYLEKFEWFRRLVNKATLSSRSEV